MRKLILLFFVLQWGALSAQNWALINPDYKYNYSNDGTDTISNQIFVTHVDTLVLDSFRYELNRVAERCINCPDTCNLRINIPQFLLGECRIGEAAWRFVGTDSLDVRPKAVLNEQWLFDPVSGVIGTITEVSTQNIFGTIDSVRMMTTSSNDTVQWSKNLGILRWHLHDGLQYDLIGIQGPGVGRLVPSLGEFFPFQPGDVVQFAGSTTSEYHTWSKYWRFHIEERTEQPGHLEFTGTSHFKHIDLYGTATYDSTQSDTWILDSATTDFLRPLYAAPGQIAYLGEDFQYPDPYEQFMVTQHAIDISGNYVIWSGPYSDEEVFKWPDTVPGDCQHVTPQWSTTTNFYYLDTRLGIRFFNHGVDQGVDWQTFGTLGAVINGDTVGTVYGDDFYHVVGIEEANLGPSKIYPAPATDHINVPDAIPGSICTVLDAQGRTLITRRLTNDRTLNVADLRTGIYLLLVNGQLPRRFSVAR